MALRVWWQYQVLVWLRWRRQRQDGGCHQLWVTGSWGGEGGEGGGGEVTAEFMACSLYPSVCLCVCLTFSLSVSPSIYLFLMPASLFQPFCLLCPVCPSLSLSLSFKYIYFFSLSPRMMGGWILPSLPCVRHCIKKNNRRPINRV